MLEYAVTLECTDGNVCMTSLAKTWLGVPQRVGNVGEFYTACRIVALHLAF